MATTSTNATSTVPTSTVPTSTVATEDVEFAISAARYLRNAGLNDDAIATSLVDELGIDLTDARNIALTI